MPPVANEEAPVWASALEQALKDNEGREDRPSTWWALAGALAAHPDSGQTRGSWKTEIARIRKGKLPTEDRAQMLADVLGVDRAQLPDGSERLSLQQLDRRLREVEEGLSSLGTELGRLAELVHPEQSSEHSDLPRTRPEGRNS